MVSRAEWCSEFENPWFYHASVDANFDPCHKVLPGFVLLDNVMLAIALHNVKTFIYNVKDKK